jgi:hypothetical protein
MGLGIVVTVVITGVGLLAAVFVLNRDLEDI